MINYEKRPNAIIVFLYIQLLLLVTGCENCEQIWRITKNERWTYRIDSMYISKNHATPTLIISNDSVHKREIGVHALEELYNNTTVGDSIMKAQGSLEFRLVKKDTVLSFYPMCNGETIK